LTGTTESRWRNAVVIGVTILAAVAAIGLVVWLLMRPDDGVSQASPTARADASPSDPTASPTAAETPPPTAWTWEVRELPGGPSLGAAHIDGLWVALDRLEAWTSTDAVTWEPATVEGPHPGEGTTQMGPITELGGAFYSVGNWFGLGDSVQPVIWRSADGTEWTLVTPSEEWGWTFANDVATDGRQLALAGNEFEFGLGHVWTSTDGSTWTERTSDSGPATMNAIHGNADGFVSVGYRLDEDGNSLPAIWHSADGESWTDASLPPTDDPVSLLDVVHVPNGPYVALGVVGVQIDAGAYVIWYADDPSTWTDATELTGGSLPGLLLATDSGVLAITGTLEGPAVRFSTDGVTWEEVPNFIQPARLARATAAATDGETIIILGGTDEADAHFVWVGRPVTE
jgi:hypothetical protein